jgi:hypothetical protein
VTRRAIVAIVGTCRTHRGRGGAAASAASASIDVRVSPELEAEIVGAMAEIDRGEYLELTPEQLDHAAATGEWPWPDDASLG